MKLLAPLKKFILFRCHSTRPPISSRGTPKETKGMVTIFPDFICLPMLVSLPSCPYWNTAMISARPPHFCRVPIFRFSRAYHPYLSDISLNVFFGKSQFPFLFSDVISSDILIVRYIYFHRLSYIMKHLTQNSKSILSHSDNLIVRTR